MKKLFFSLLLLHTAVFCFGQLGFPYHFKIRFEPVLGETVPGIHSFAYATYGSKWVFVGGRTNGMHGMNSNSNFETEFANTNIVVVDTIDWQWTSAPVTQLPQAIADPLSSTNMQYWANDTTLYMVGGYGWDSIAEEFNTYPTLTAIDIAGIVNAVETGDSLRPHIRQYVDTSLAVCGGELIQMDSLYYLVMGHKFTGRYSAPQITYEQHYTNAIRRFSIVDDGVTLSIANFAEDVDTNNFHRRDLNAVRMDFPGVSKIGILGGVFQKGRDLPFTRDIFYGQGWDVEMDTMLTHKFNQYTAAHIVLLESSDIYNVIMLGGMGSYKYNDTTLAVMYDSLVPFSKTISMLRFNSSGRFDYDNYYGPYSIGEMPGYLGSNAIFINAGGFTPTSSHAISMADLPSPFYQGQSAFLGYLFGGIRGTAPNFGISSANDTIYRLYADGTFFDNVAEIPGLSNVQLYPNPGNGMAVLSMKLEKAQKMNIVLLSANGSFLQTMHSGNLLPGQQTLQLAMGNLSAGLYFIRIETPQGTRVVKYSVVQY